MIEDVSSLVTVAVYRTISCVTTKFIIVDEIDRRCSSIRTLDLADQFIHDIVLYKCVSNYQVDSKKLQ